MLINVGCLHKVFIVRLGTTPLYTNQKFEDVMQKYELS